jgi:hypothetical protein
VATPKTQAPADTPADPLTVVDASTSEPEPAPAPVVMNELDALHFAAVRLYPTLFDHKHGGGCVVARDPDSGQYVHIAHDLLRTAK